MFKIGKRVLIGTLSLGLLLAGAGMCNVSAASAAGGQGGSMPMMGGQGQSWWLMMQNNQGQFNQRQNNQGQFGQGQNNQMGSGQGQFNQQQQGQGGMGQIRGNIISQVADILNDYDEDVDEQTIRDALQDGQTLAEIAEDYGVDEDTLLSEMEELQTEAIDAAVTAGTITDDQAEKMKENLAERLENMVEGTNSQGQNNQMGFGQGQFNQQQQGQGGMNQVGGNIISQVADILNDYDEDVDEQTIRDALQDGQTLAEIAEDYGVDEDTLLSELEELQTEAIDASVTAGTITDDQADNLKEGLAERLESFVEGTFSKTVSSLSAPTDLEATADGSDEIDLTWDSVSDATSYYVYRATSSSGSYTKIATVTDNSYEDTDVDEGTTYYYKVKAVNDDGVSAYSEKDSATTDDE